jgi:hypothetical protein
MSVQITTPEGTAAERNNCGTCGSCELMPGGYAVCRRNPPGRSPGGAAIWPPVNPERDWCMQWTAQT